MAIRRGDAGLTQKCTGIILVVPWEVLWCDNDPILWDNPGCPRDLTWGGILSMSKFTCPVLELERGAS